MQTMQGHSEESRLATLLYVVYIAFFLGLLALAGMMFGFTAVTVGMAAFTIIIIFMIEYFSRLIAGH